MGSAALRLKLIQTAVVSVALAGCGKSIRSIDADTGPRDAAVGDPNDPCIQRPPITEPTANCAYPLAPMDTPPLLPSVTTLSRPGCRHRLGEPVALPWGESATGGIYAGFIYQFSFDVNGDDVGDIFFWDESYGGIRLALSGVAGGRLSYEVVDCDALGHIPYGRVFVRDINGDSVPDLVVGPSSYDLVPTDHPLTAPADVGIVAFVNLPSGFVEVLRHEWEGPGKTTLIDVAVGDFDGNDACIRDVAFGYDRVTPDVENPVEFGMLMSLVEGTWPDLVIEQRAWVTNAWTSEPIFTLGEIAAGTAVTRPPLVLAGNAADPGKVVQGALYLRWNGDDPDEQLLQVQSPPTTSSHTDDGPFDPWILPFAGATDALALLYPESLVLYDLRDPRPTPLPVLLSLATVGVHRRDRGLGGGPTAATRFMIDVDGDGDVDFVEHVDDGTGTLKAAIHSNLGGASFGEPSVFDLLHPNVAAESPFVGVGAARAALIVNEFGSSPTGELIESPSVQALQCAEN